MVRTRKAPHVVPKLGQEDVGGAPAHARHGIAPRHLSFRLVEAVLAFGREAFHRLVQIFHRAEMRREETGMMGLHPPGQCLFERRALTPQPPSCQRRQGLDSRFALDQPWHHGACRHPSDIPDNGRQLPSGILPHLLQPVATPCPFRHQRATMARQLSQGALRGRGDHAPPSQAMVP
jgi:hypothetical protein